MKQRWDQSILFLTTVVVILISVVIGTLFIEVAKRTASERTQQLILTSLSELLDTVESTVSAACYSGDKVLAQEIANGIRNNSAVLGVVISTNTQEIARKYGNDIPERIEVSTPNGRLIRAIHSPLNKDEIIGKILLDPDPVEIERQVDLKISYLTRIMIVQIASTSTVIFLVILFWIVRPIKYLSDRLHHINAAAGERLSVPYGHAQTEIGRLADDINTLTANLVTSIEDEQMLRMQYEIGENKYHAIFNNAETGIFIVNRKSLIESFNPAFLKLLELPADSTHEISKRLLAKLAWKFPDSLNQLINDCIDTERSCSADMEYLMHDGTTHWFNLLFSPVGDEKAQGIVSDVTERKLAENTAQHQIITDPLTGVYNRLGLEMALDAHIHNNNKSSETDFALMLINFDGFKRVNEALGLPVGDDVLKNASKRLSSCLKPDDTIARIGGDEFAVVLPHTTDINLIERISERIINVLRERYDVHTTPIHLGVSIGITRFPADGNQIPSLLRNAEFAMGRAKTNGGNRCTFFKSSMSEEAEQRRALEMEMQQALQRDEFRLFYQPIVDITSNRMVGAEALIRWQHPVKGLVFPDTFIPMAEETGLVIDIGLWVLEAACKQLAEWKMKNKDYYISINISGRQIPAGIAPQKLLEIVQKYHVAPSSLALEITEGVLLSDVNQALSWLNAVREMGFRVYLDDFGTGYSSLSYLKRFPVNTVKIDKSFIREMSSDSSDHALVEAIIAMTKSLGLEVVAEGVENLDQLELLRKLNCRNIQGYYFSKAVSADEFAGVATQIHGMLNTIPIPDDKAKPDEQG